MGENKELKRCPFCGGEAERVDLGENKIIQARCKDCYAMHPLMEWNTRNDSELLAEAVELLREIRNCNIEDEAHVHVKIQRFLAKLTKEEE